MTKKELTDGLAASSIYFAKNVALNKAGYESIGTVMKRGAKSLLSRAFEAAANERDALILFFRTKKEFVKGFVPNSIFIGLDGSLAPWVGKLVPDLIKPILIIALKGKK